MGSVEHQIDIALPRQTVYNQWTQFEEFPRFMHGIDEVRQLDDTHLHWKASIGGVTREWDAVITEQVPDRLIAWRSTDGTRNSGVVTFDRLTENRTRIALVMEVDPRGTVERVADALNLPDQRVVGDLEAFRDFIEARGHETGAWRGSVN